MATSGRRNSSGRRDSQSLSPSPMSPRFAESPKDSNDSVKKQWQKAAVGARSRRTLGRAKTLDVKNLETLKLSEKDKEAEAQDDIKKPKKDDEPKKVTKFADVEDDDDENLGKVERKTERAITQQRWKRVSLWAKVGFPMVTGVQGAAQEAKARATIARGDAIKAIEKVRLWKEAETRKDDCSKYRFRAHLARRMVYKQAKDYLDTDHKILALEDGQKKHIKEIFHSILVGVRQVLLLNKVANIFMVLIAEHKIRDRLARATKELCQTHDWRLYKLKLAEVKKEMHEAMDLHRDMVDFAAPQEQIQVVQELVDKQENVRLKAGACIESLKKLQAFLPKDCQQIQETEQSEQLWKKLMQGRKTLRVASQTQRELQQAISLLGRGGYDEGSSEDLESDEAAARDQALLAKLAPHVHEKLQEILEEQGADSFEAEDMCKSELVALGLSKKEASDTFAALQRAGWRKDVNAAAGKLKAEESLAALQTLKSKIEEYEPYVPESIKQKFPVTDTTDRLSDLQRLRKQFAKPKMVVPAYEIPRRLSELPLSNHDFANAYLQKTRDLLSGSRQGSRRQSLEGDPEPSPSLRSPRTSQALESKYSLRLSSQDISAKLARSRSFSNSRFNFSHAENSESDSGDSDKEDKEEKKDNAAEAENDSTESEENSDKETEEVRAEFPGLKLARSGSTLLEVPGRRPTIPPSSPEQQAITHVPVVLEEVEGSNVADEGGQSSESGEEDKHEPPEKPCNEASEVGLPDVQAIEEHPHIKSGEDVVETEEEDKTSSATYPAASTLISVDANEHWTEGDLSEPAVIEPISSDEVMNALEELRQKVISTFQGVEEAAKDLASCGGDVGGSGMISLAALHRRLQEESDYKRGLAEVCSLFRALDLTFCVEETTITQEQFLRLNEIDDYYEEVKEDAQVAAELRKLFKAVQLRRVLTNTISEDEHVLSAVAVALSNCKDAVAGVVDAGGMQPLLDAMDCCFQCVHGENCHRFAAAVLSKWGLRILTDVIVCSTVSKEIRAASVILISESLAYHGLPPCSPLNDDIVPNPQRKRKSQAEAVQVEPSVATVEVTSLPDEISHLSEDFLMQELWRPLLDTIDPEAPILPQPLDPQLLEQMFLLLLQVHMPAWILGDHGTELAAELSLALRKLHACPMEAKTLLRALRTFRIFEDDKEAQHSAAELHTLSAALGGCRLLREQLALLHAHVEADGELKGHGASATFARQGDHMLRLWRAARERLFVRWPLLRQKPLPLQKLKALLQATEVAISQGFQAAEPRKQSIPESAKPTDPVKKEDDKTSEAVADMDPFFLVGSVEREAVFRLEQRWKMAQKEQQHRLISYDWSRPSIPPLAQATKQSQAYLARNGAMPLPLPMLPPRSSQGKRRKKKQEVGQQRSDGVHVVMLSSGPPLLCKTSRVPSRSTPRPGRSLQPLSDSQVGRAPWAWDEVPGQPTRRVQTANGGPRSRDLPWTVQDEPRERSRPCTTGKLGIEDMSVSRAAWQVQNGPAWRQKHLGPLPALDHFPERRQGEQVHV